MKLKKLNLGCGHKVLDGFIGVDKYGTPDEQVDLEVFPWPWEDNSIDEIMMSHVLEHLGATSDSFLNIMKELYRVCKNEATIHIFVPDPRSDGYLGDPTHVRPININVLNLFSKKENEMYIEKGWPNTTIALFLDIDFEIIHYNIKLMPYWQEQYDKKILNQEELIHSLTHYNNVVDELEFKLKVNK